MSELKLTLMQDPKAVNVKSPPKHSPSRRTTPLLNVGGAQATPPPQQHTVGPMKPSNVTMTQATLFSVSSPAALSVQKSVATHRLMPVIPKLKLSSNELSKKHDEKVSSSFQASVKSNKPPPPLIKMPNTSPTTFSSLLNTVFKREAACNSVLSTTSTVPKKERSVVNTLSTTSKMEVNTPSTASKREINTPSTASKREIGTTSTASKREIGTTSTASKREINTTSTASKREIDTTSTASKREISTTSTTSKREINTTSTASKREIGTTSTASKREINTTSTASKREIGTTSTAFKREINTTSTASKREATFVPMLDANFVKLGNCKQQTKEQNAISPPKAKKAKSVKTALLPVSRVKTIMKTNIQSSQTGLQLSQDSVLVITKATELFISELGQGAKKAALFNGSTTVGYNQLAQSVHESDKLEFLHEILPKKVLARDYLAASYTTT